jgi:hypothetical protein
VRREKQKADAGKQHDDTKPDFKTALEMAHLLHLSELELAQLCKSGVLHRSTERRAGRLHYVFDVAATVGAYIEHLKAPARQAKESWVFEKTETQRIVREHKQMELDYARGDLVKKSRVRFVLTNMLTAMKSKLLGLGPNCARLVAGQDPAKARRILDEYGARVLQEIADFNPDLFDEPHKNGQHEDIDRTIATRLRKRRGDAKRP